MSTAGFNYSVCGYDDTGDVVYMKRRCGNSGLGSCINWAFRKGAVKVVITKLD